MKSNFESHKDIKYSIFFSIFLVKLEFYCVVKKKNMKIEGTFLITLQESCFCAAVR